MSSPLPTFPTGLRYMVASAFWFSVMGLGVKVAGARLPSMQIVLVRAVFTLLLSLALVRRAGLSLRGGNRLLLISRGVTGFMALTCLYFALVHLPLAEATVIHYSNPVFVAPLAAWLLHERLTRADVACAIAGFVGVVLVAQPSFLFGSATGFNPLYVGIAFLGTISSAISYVTVRRLRDRDHPLVVVTYFPLVAVPLALPFAIPVWLWPTPLEWLLLVGIGIATQCGQVYLTMGLQLEAAGRATAVAYVQILFAAIWGMLIFRDIPSWWTALGALVILVSTVVLARQDAPAVTPAT